MRQPDTAMAHDFVGAVDLRDAADLASIVAIRRQVFSYEQRVSASVEIDVVDRRARHVIGLHGDLVVGAGRLQILDGEGQIAWVAVLPRHRGLGIGNAIMVRLLEIADETGLHVVLLNAQTHALRFYTRLGFIPIGEVFTMGGIEHQLMSRRRPSSADDRQRPQVQNATCR